VAKPDPEQAEATVLVELNGIEPSRSRFARAGTPSRSMGRGLCPLKPPTEVDGSIQPSLRNAVNLEIRRGDKYWWS